MTNTTEIEGDLFDAPENAVLIRNYRTAFYLYRNHCADSDETKEDIIGTTLLIPPQVRDMPHKHWIACLLVSVGVGTNKSGMMSIIKHTRTALHDLKVQIAARKDQSPSQAVGPLYACRINEGLFKVEWLLSKKLLEDSELRIVVMLKPQAEGDRFGECYKKELKSIAAELGLSTGGTKSDLLSKVRGALSPSTKQDSKDDVEGDEDGEEDADGNEDN
ncbi:MAG: ADP-ribose 1''-phosphate phosphatase [Pycnora praestabilis]|nr:MAG: ADP-ribose 1''-phosphate phosphatase [Pycnora praestabilis]